MSEFKGTKGKWYLENYTDHYTNIVRCDNGVHNTIFLGSTTQCGGEEARANALLMSKAPEMLEMISELLKELAFHGYQHSTTIYNAHNLIKEATTIQNQ